MDKEKTEIQEKPVECLNRPVLERIAREVFHFEDEDRIDAFISEFVIASLYY